MKLAVALTVVLLSGLFFKLAVWAFAPRSPNGFFRAAVLGMLAPVVVLTASWLALGTLTNWVGPFAWFVAVPTGVLAGLTLISTFYGMSIFRAFFVASLYAMTWFLAVGVLVTPRPEAVAEAQTL